MIADVKLSHKTDDDCDPVEVRMTESFIVQQCKAHRGYSTPELNEKLYLHHFGFSRIENLDPYVGCTVLYITHNAISDLSPLRCLLKLDSLYVSNNSLRSLETLPHLPALRQLDVSHNYLTELKGLADKTPALEILLASHNTIQSLEGVGELRLLTSLDVSYNKLRLYDEANRQISPLAPTMSTLIFSGNKLVHSRNDYRKFTIHQYPALHFLDEYPVFPEERRKATAYAEGGLEAEVQVVKNIKIEDLQAKQQQFKFFAGEREAAVQRRDPQKSSTKYFEEQRDDDIFIPCAFK